MKCKLCGEVFASSVVLWLHNLEHERANDRYTAPVVDYIYGSTGNTFFGTVPRAAVNNLRLGKVPQKTPLTIVVPISQESEANGTRENNADVMRGNGISNIESLRGPKHYTHEELRAILKFHLKLK